MVNGSMLLHGIPNQRLRFRRISMPQRWAHRGDGPPFSATALRQWDEKPWKFTSQKCAKLGFSPWIMIENVELCIKIGGKPANFRGLTSKNSDFTTTSGECLTAADDEGDCSRLCDGVIDLYCLEQGRRLSENGTQDTGKTPFRPLTVRVRRTCTSPAPRVLPRNERLETQFERGFLRRCPFPCANIMPTHLMLLSASGASCRAGNSAASIAPLWSKKQTRRCHSWKFPRTFSGIVIDLGKPAVHAMAAFWGALGSSVVVGGTKALLFLIVVSQVIGSFGRAWIIGCTAPRSQSGNIAMLDLSVAICSAVSTTMAFVGCLEHSSWSSHCSET